ncbi:hypothetical protein R6Q57_028631 [Mikania cordata]
MQTEKRRGGRAQPYKTFAMAENITDKAKQTAQDAWNSAKEAVHKGKENVPQKSDEAANFVKENIDIAKRKMYKD